ncbi:MAG: signal peptidase II [Actinobacteria bacterium]|nr:signal peptidase II [Actinomycetota bacterium]
MNPRRASSTSERTHSGQVRHGGRLCATARARCLAVAALTASIVIVADQVATSWALTRLARGPIHVMGPLNLQLVMNTGFSFGIARGNSSAIAVVAGVLVVILIWAVTRARTVPLSLAYGMIIGGAVGNLADRLFRGTHGAVADFISFKYGPTFNVADACIDIGGLLVVIIWTRRSMKEFSHVSAGDATADQDRDASNWTD